MCNISPCKECNHRELGCHSNCCEYLEWNNNRKKENEVINNERNKLSLIAGYEVNKTNRLRKSYKR